MMRCGQRSLLGFFSILLTILLVLPASAQKPGWEKRRINLTLRNKDINATLELLTEMAGLNIVSGPQVKGTVSVRLEQVPLGEALNAILNVNGFGYVEGDNVIKILPLKEIGNAITQTFKLNYALADKLEKSLQDFVSEHGSVKGDEGSNTLIVTDIPDNLRKIGQLVEELDRKPYQVLIEAHVIDLKVSDDLDYGIDWSLVNYDNPRSSVSVTAAPELSHFGQVRFGIIRNRYDLDAIIRSMQELSNARILSSPRIVALDHKEAEMHVGQEVPYTTVTTDESGRTQYSTSFRKSGTVLKVTPHVTHDGHVLMELEPSQSFVVEWIGATPVLDTRTAVTELLLDSGETAVIGGLRKNDVTTTEAGVPILSAIPLLGYLFKSKRTSDVDIELLVLVTPHILEGSEIVVQERTPFSEDGARPMMDGVRKVYYDSETEELVKALRKPQGASEVTQ